MSFTKKKKRKKKKKEKKDINICQMSIVKPGPVIMTQSTNIKNRRVRKQCLCLLCGFRFFYVGDNRAFETSILNQWILIYNRTATARFQGLTPIFMSSFALPPL